MFCNSDRKVRISQGFYLVRNFANTLVPEARRPCHIDEKENGVLQLNLA